MYTQFNCGIKDCFAVGDNLDSDEYFSFIFYNVFYIFYPRIMRGNATFLIIIVYLLQFLELCIKDVQVFLYSTY